MADAKVSELVSATSLGGSDQLYVVQSNTSKKITAATLFANAANVVLSGNTTFGGTPQTLGAPGIININTPITQLSADAIGGTLQIPNGASGQVKIVTMTSTAGGSYTFNTSNIAGNVNVTLDSVGDTVVFIFTNGKWFPITSTSGINLTSISSNVIPSANSVYDLGSATKQWRSLYVSNNTIFIGGTPLTIENGELVVGSGEASANLATVAYVDGAVANAGGGNTGDITFVGNTISSEGAMAIEASESVTIAYTDGSTSESVFYAEQGLASITVIDSGTPGAKLQLNSSNVAINNGQGSNPIDLTVSGNVIANRFTSSANGITIESTTNNIEITANADVSIVALDDLRLTGNDTVALRNRSNSASINIITDFDDSAFNWEFGVDGILRTPGDVIVSGDITGWVGGTLYIKVDPESNTFIQLNDTVDSSIRTQANLEIRTNGLNPFTWVFDTNGLLTTPSDVNIEGGLTLSQTAITGNRDFNVVNINSAPNPNAYVQLNDTGDSFFGAHSNVLITTGGDVYEWKFGADSILTLPGNLHFSGCSISAINSVSNSSGDGIGASTLQIVPDKTLFNNDQYIIIDPTEPDHIHIRGGGAIDNCSAKLIIGGENSHFAVQAGANASVSIRADGQNWNFGTDGILSAPGSISSAGIISTGKSKFDKIVESYSGTINPTGNVTFDCSSSHIFNVTSINTNFTVNITNLELDNGEATSVTLVLNQGATAYIANALQISGTTQTIRWQANTVPTGNVNAVDVQTFSILNVSGNYTVLGQLTTFG